MEMTQPSPKKEWELTGEAFSKFLTWLDPNPDRAGELYEDIRRRLIKIFGCRGCTCPEDLSDETINRVIRKVQEIGESYVGDRALYFYGVAHKVHLEYLRRKPVPTPPPAPGKPRSEDEYACLEQCMERLTVRSRELVLAYYQEEKRAKIDWRRQLAAHLGIPLNALRIRACRIRANLEGCVSQCLQALAAG
jgi:DNA-directed RNA polymerase specialized sigma24 family protein